MVCCRRSSVYSDSLLDKAVDSPNVPMLSAQTQLKDQKFVKVLGERGAQEERETEGKEVRRGWGR
jgi:hypothetical protein